jgi:hypothetical protein
MIRLLEDIGILKHVDMIALQNKSVNPAYSSI